MFQVLIQHQPALRMRILCDQTRSVGTRRRFAEIDDIKFDINVIKGTDRRSWLTIAESELSVPIIANEGPLWRLRYVDFAEIAESESLLSDSTRSECLTEGALMFVIHQAIADGLSMFNMMHTQLIPIINSMIGGEDTSLFKLPLPMMHSVDDAFLEKSKKTWNTKSSLKRKNKTRAPNPEANHVVEYDPPLVFHLSTDPSEPCSEMAGTGVLPFSLTTTGTCMLLSECTRHNTSLHSVLLTACSVALGILSEAYGVENNHSSDDISVGFSMDLRRLRTHGGADSLGMWEGYQTQNVKRYTTLPPAKRLWDEAKRVCQNYRTSEQRPWTILASFNDTMKRIEKENDFKAISDMFKVHVQLDNIGFCKANPSTTDSGASTSSPSSDTPNGVQTNIGGRRYKKQTQTGKKQKTRFRLSPSGPSSPPSGRSSIEISPDDPEYTSYSAVSMNSSSFGDFIRHEEHFFMSSMCDLSGVPLVVSVCIFRDSLMWTVAYNTKWIMRSFAIDYVDSLLRVFKHMVINLHNI